MAYNITMVVYTKRGDRGETGLFSPNPLKKRRISKASLRIAAIGAIDEANSFLGVVSAFSKSKALKREVEEIQRDLFTIGAILAGVKLRLDPGRVKVFEERIDKLQAKLPVSNNFIVPDGGKAGSLLHYARTQVRKAERTVVTLNNKQKVDSKVLVYLNRLSDFLFMLARESNYKEKKKEKYWVGKKA